MKHYDLSSDSNNADARRDGHEVPAPGSALGLSKAHTVTFSITGKLIEPLDPLYENPDIFLHDDIGTVRTDRNGQPKELVGEVRDIIQGFSPAARRRMFKFIARLGEAIPIMITLTYRPVLFPETKEELKGHLKKFWQMLQRKYPDQLLGGIYKVELQKSGVPHFHLLVYRLDGSQPFVDKDWCALAWAKASGDTSEDHINAGTRVEAIRSSNGALSYAAKYLGKTWKGKWKYGKVWNWLTKKNLPICETIDVELDSDELRHFEEHCRHVHAEKKAKAMAQKEFPDEFTEEEVKELGSWTKMVNDEARTWRRDIRNHYYHENQKLFKAEPWKVSYWTIMNENTFAELRDRARRERESAIELINCFVNGTLPDCWYSEFNAPRDPFGDDPESIPFVKKMREEWRTYSCRVVGYLMSLTEKRH